MALVNNSIFIRGDANKIFDFVTTARYWPEWHPATVGVSGQIEMPMRLGDVIRERAKIGGMEAENDWTVTEWERPRRVVLTMPSTRLGDLQITYGFVENEDGVDFSRELVFDARGFDPARREKIQKQMETDSAEALRRIKALIEAR